MGRAKFEARPHYREFRSCDVRHAFAGITKACTCLGHEFKHRIDEGQAEAMDWLARDLG